MRYILDSNSISVFKNYYPTTFPSFWELVDGIVAEGTLMSVREVFNELQRDNRAAFVLDWAKRNRAIFPIPTDDETAVVGQILV